MDRGLLPLNALRAFEASARHLNFTRAGLELRVSQGAVSHQVAQLEDRLGTRLFHRLPRGLALTDAGAALVPTLVEAFDRISLTLDGYADGRFREPLHIGVVGTFATGWLMERLDDFAAHHPHIDLKLSTNNNRPDLAGEGLDFAIRFGDGAWHGTHADPICAAPLTVLASPGLAAQLASPSDVLHHRRLRSYRADEWPRWFAAAGIATGPTGPSGVASVAGPQSGPTFDSSVLMVAAAINGHGLALAPSTMFVADLTAGRLIQPFPITIDSGRYWLTRLLSKTETPAMQSFRTWLLESAG